LGPLSLLARLPVKKGAGKNSCTFFIILLRWILFFVGGLQDTVQQNVGAGCTVFPGGIFDLYVAAAADAGNKYHRRRANLIHFI
jgi:hypothetical protein